MKLTDVELTTRDNGKKFGRLLAVKFIGWRKFRGGKWQQVWEYNCDCGKTIQALMPNVRSGHTKSCGCYARFRTSQVKRTHGDSFNKKTGTIGPLYVIWCGMRQRCYTPNLKRFGGWGGRGIKIEWEKYEDFKRDMEPSYCPGLSIERIDNNGNYSKSNCKWIPRSEQSQNKRNTIWIENDGIRLNLSQWAKRVGIKVGTLRMRIKSGWDISKALTTPLLKITKLS